MGRSTRIQNSADDLDDLEKLYAAREFSKPSETLRGAQASQNFICGRWKIIIALGFLTCAAVAPAILYIYLSQQEASNFNTAYTTLTNELQATIRSNLYNKYFSVNELSTLYSSIPNVVWPDVLYPLFYPVASNLCASSDCYQISFHPLVNSSSSRLYAWEQYVNTIKEDWKASQGLPPDIFIDNEIYSGFRNLQASLTNDSFALPKWQVFPFSPYEQSSLLLNSLDSPSYRSSILPLLTGNASSSLLFGTESSPEFIELSYPIFNLIPSANSSSPIVGIINLIFEQGSLFSGLTFADEGILCDIQLPSTSSSESTTSVFFFLSRDQVDRISDPSIWSDLSNSRVLNITSFYPISPGARETLEIVVTTYPSRSYTSNYITNWPLIYAFLLGSFVMIVWLVFFVYDYTVTIKINSLTTLANSATTVVDELFPSFVRDRLYRLKRSGTSAEALMLLDSPKSFTQPDMVTEDEELGQLQRLRRNSLDHIMATLTSTRRRHRSSVSTLSTSGDTFEPIAKLFQHATVLFADVAGFTKWSAQRSPADVFDLLESLFLIFDRAAEKRGVFKIETIGDCYMAVSGIPDEETDHASKMADFALDMLSAIPQLRAMKGEPFMKGLQLRIGMNSGPVTAGVLRGTKSRFQLFGDTVNTASRMESCGEPGRIHLSASTTYYLQEDETPHRVVPRTTRITPKGKGTMDTYWLLPFDSEDVGNANDIGVEHHGTKSRIQGRT